MPSTESQNRLESRQIRKTDFKRCLKQTILPNRIALKEIMEFKNTNLRFQQEKMNNLHSHKGLWKGGWNWKSVWFVSNWISPLAWLIFVRRWFRYMIASVLEQKTFQRSCFCSTKSSLPIGLVRRFFSRDIGEKNSIFRKTAAVNLNFQQNFYGNCASVVLSRLAAVSTELTAISEK